MSDEKSASQVAIELLQEAYDEVESKNYSGALQRCQAALAIYQKIGDRTGVAYTLATITDICRLSLESLEPLLSESDSRPDIGSRKPFSLLLEPDSGSDAEPPPPPALQKNTNRLRIRIERGEPDPGPPPRPSRLIIEIDRLILRKREGEPEPPPPPPPLRPSRLVIELTELEPPPTSPPSP